MSVNGNESHARPEVFWSLKRTAEEASLRELLGISDDLLGHCRPRAAEACQFTNGPRMNLVPARENL